MDGIPLINARERLMKHCDRDDRHGTIDTAVQRCSEAAGLHSQSHSAQCHLAGISGHSTARFAGERGATGARTARSED